MDYVVTFSDIGSTYFNNSGPGGSVYLIEGSSSYATLITIENS